jgi:hypothetical protein
MFYNNINMRRFSMAFDNPQLTRTKQHALYITQMEAQNKPKRYGIDLATPMIQRVYKAKPGCSACGK